MPEICSRCGELTAPPHRITSRAARHLAVDAALAERDAGAAPALEQQPGGDRVGLDPRLPRPRASRRKVCAVEPRHLPRRVICE